MALNIKNQEAHRLAAELAALTGQSMTAAVIEALQVRLQQIKRREDAQLKVQRLMAIGQRCAAHIKQPLPAVEHSNILYDEKGMPV